MTQTTSNEDRAKLVSLARRALEAYVLGQLTPSVENVEGIFAQKRGGFVTLTNQGQLRGCIGTFMPHAPLAEMIVEMATSAARDPRFTMNPITPAELGQIHIEVSLLSQLEQTTAPEELQVGTHGIYIIQGRNSGCFLPEVATDCGWQAEEFLDNCCTHKAGLPAGAWRSPETTIYLFSSEKFGE